MSRRIGDIETAAAEIAMSVSWLRQRVMRKQIPFLKVGRRVLFDLDELNNFVRTRCRQEPEADLISG
jgi:excisionase family DNA binding protein